MKGASAATTLKMPSRTCSPPGKQRSVLRVCVEHSRSPCLLRILVPVDHREILCRFRLNLLDAAFAAQEDRFVADHHLDRIAHAAQRLVHHRANLLLSDQSCVGFGCTRDCDLRTSGGILGWVRLHRIDAATTADEQSLAIHFDRNRITHAAEWFAADRTNLLARDRRRSELLLARRYRSDFLKCNRSASGRRNTYQLNVYFDLSPGDRRKIDGAVSAPLPSGNRSYRYRFALPEMRTEAAPRPLSTETGWPDRSKTYIWMPPCETTVST